MLTPIDRWQVLTRGVLHIAMLHRGRVSIDIIRRRFRVSQDEAADLLTWWEKQGHTLLSEDDYLDWPYRTSPN